MIQTILLKLIRLQLVPLPHKPQMIEVGLEMMEEDVPGFGLWMISIKYLCER